MPGLIIADNAGADRILEAEAEYRRVGSLKDDGRVFEHQLIGYLQRAWQAARTAKEPIHDEMLRCLRQRNGEYEPETLQRIREDGGSEIYMMLSSVKARAAESWLEDMIFGHGKRPWNLDPTPVPDLPVSIAAQVAKAVHEEAARARAMGVPVDQRHVDRRYRAVKGRMLDMARRYAEEVAERAADKVEDLAVEAGFRQALSDFITHMVTYPTGILKGPVIRRKRGLQWQIGPDGSMVPMAGEDLIPHVYAPNPFDIYLAPNASSVGDGFVIERHQMRRHEFAELRDAGGYDDAGIDEILSRYGRSGYELHSITQDERDRLEHQHAHEFDQADPTIDVLEYSGFIRGECLIGYGIANAGAIDPNREYMVNAWWVGDILFRCMLDEDPLQRSRYAGASVESAPGQPWGKGYMQLVRDCQMMCNAAARSLATNMAFASGPMGGYDIGQLAEGEDPNDIRPWKMWQWQSSEFSTGSRPPMMFFQPKSNASELMKVFEFYSRLADEYSGIPQYAQGINPSGGAAGTASGMSMLMNAASRGIKRVVGQIDKVIEHVVQRLYEHEMQYGADPSLKMGDIKVVATGARSLMHRESQAMRRTEILQTLTNPVDQQLIGASGRAAMLREVLEAAEIDPTEILPDEEALRKMDDMMRYAPLMQMQQAAQQAQAARPPGPREQNLAGEPAGGQEQKVV